MKRNQFEVSRHVYDLDIIEVLFKLKERVGDRNNLVEGVNPGALKERWESVIKDYCDTNGIDFSKSLTKGSLIVPVDHGFYLIALVMKLQAIDTFKVPMLLDYQKGLASNYSEFIGMLEFNLLNSFKNNSAFIDSDEKLAAIVSWITSAKSKLKKVSDTKEKSFESLFRDKDYPKILKSLLEANSITESGLWVGFTKHRTEVNVLIRLLQEKGKLFKLPLTQITKLFCKEFGIQLSERSMRNEPKTAAEVEREYRRVLI